MTENQVREAAEIAASEVLMAWLFATQPEINLEDPRALPRAFVSLPVPSVVPEALHDVHRAVMRDKAARILGLAAVMRRNLS